MSIAAGSPRGSSPRDQAKAVRAELANYKRLRKLTEEWVGLALRLAKEKRKLTA